MDKVIYSCSKHIEELLDVFLDETYEMPIMETASSTGNPRHGPQELANYQGNCAICNMKAVYKLSGSEVKVEWE